MIISVSKNQLVTQPSTHFPENLNKSKMTNNNTPLRRYLDQLKHDPTLISSIALYNEQVTDEELEELAETLKDNHIVKRITLGNITGLSEKGIRAIAEVLTVNKTINAVLLLGNQINDAGIKILADTFAVNHTITEFSLGDDDFTTEGFKHIANLIGNNKSIEKFALYQNQISDQKVEIIADALKDNTTLQELDLSDNNITNIGAEFLIEALVINTTLVKIDLDNSQINPELLQKIASYLEKNQSMSGSQEYQNEEVTQKKTLINDPSSVPQSVNGQSLKGEKTDYQTQ